MEIYRSSNYNTMIKKQQTLQTLRETYNFEKISREVENVS